MAAAAAWPVATPSVFAGPSGMESSDAARAASSAAALAGKYWLGSTACAAAAAAASGDAPSGAEIVPVWTVLAGDRIDRLEHRQFR